MLDGLKSFLRAGYVFIPTNDRGQRKEEALSIPLLKRKGLTLEALSSSKMKIGAALTADLGKRLHAGPAFVIDADSGKKVGGILLSWQFK